MWPDWASYWTLGNFLKPLARVNLPKFPTFLSIFCKGVKIYHFSSVINFGQLLQTFGDFFWSHWRDGGKSKNKWVLISLRKLLTRFFSPCFCVSHTNEKFAKNNNSNPSLLDTKKLSGRISSLEVDFIKEKRIIIELTRLIHSLNQQLFRAIKNGPNPANFLFIFVFFTTQTQI